MATGRPPAIPEEVRAQALAMFAGGSSGADVHRWLTAQGIKASPDTVERLRRKVGADGKSKVDRVREAGQKLLEARVELKGVEAEIDAMPLDVAKASRTWAESAQRALEVMGEGSVLSASAFTDIMRLVKTQTAHAVKLTDGDPERIGEAMPSLQAAAGLAKIGRDLLPGSVALAGIAAGAGSEKLRSAQEQEDAAKPVPFSEFISHPPAGVLPPAPGDQP